MLLHFRQGIVEAQIPTFIQVTYPHVDLLVTDTNCTIAFAAGQKDYLFTEQQAVAKAWGPLYLGIDQWLYWDLDIRTGNRTFGITKVAPINSPTQPASPAMDQHWFNTLTNEMKVWTGAAWVKRIRAFACKLAQGRIPVSMSANAPLFTGTQVGNNTTTYVGHILYDATTGNAIRDASGNFMTTEDNLSTKTISLSQVKVASIIVEGVAQQNMAAHTIVRFTDFGKIVHADQFIANQPIQYGIIEQSVTVGQTVNVVTNGMVSSESFDFTDVGVNALLYCDAAGQLVSDPVIPGQVPVAVVVDRKTIQLGVALASNNETIPEVNLATNLAFGISRLSVPAEDESDPIVVGDNDPRWNSFVRKAGDSMSGPLFLNGAPTLDLHAATKKYVDDSRTPAAGNTFEVQYNINGEFAASDSLKLWLPDENYNGMSLNVGSSNHVSATITTNAWAGNLQIEGGGRQDSQPGSAVLQGGVLYTTTMPETGPGTIFGGHAMVTGGPGRGEYGRAGDAWMQGGSGDWINGRALVHGGTNYDVALGRSTANGGNVQIDGGAAQGASCPYNGGGVIIRGGRAEGTGTPGNVELHTNEVARLGVTYTGAWAVGPTQNTGTDGQVLTSRGPNTDPEWADPQGGSGLADRIVSGDVTLLVNNAAQHSQFFIGNSVVSESTVARTDYYGELSNYWVSTAVSAPAVAFAANHTIVNSVGQVISAGRYPDRFSVIIAQHASTGEYGWSYELYVDDWPDDWPNGSGAIGVIGLFNIDDTSFVIILTNEYGGFVVSKRSWSTGDIISEAKITDAAGSSWVMPTSSTINTANNKVYIGSSTESLQFGLILEVDLNVMALTASYTLSHDAYVGNGGTRYVTDVVTDDANNLYVLERAAPEYNEGAADAWIVTKLNADRSVSWTVHRAGSTGAASYTATKMTISDTGVLVVGTIKSNDPFFVKPTLLVLNKSTGSVLSDIELSVTGWIGSSIIATNDHYIVVCDTYANVQAQDQSVLLVYLTKQLQVVQSVVLSANSITQTDTDSGNVLFAVRPVVCVGNTLYLTFAANDTPEVEY